MMVETHPSYKQILKATGIVGGAQAISVVVRIVRTKLIAILLGPVGVGTAGLFQSTLDIVQNATGLGLGFSAVRDVAEAAGSGDGQNIGRTITILRRWVWLTGLLGVVLLVLFRQQFSWQAFKNTDHASEFLLLAVVPLLTAISGGQMALLRGIRRIEDIARAGVLAAVASLCITIPIYWLAGVKGIVPVMVLTAVADLGLSFFYARRLRVERVAVTLRETISGGAGMIRLGLFTVISGLANTGALYLVRVLIASRMGVEGVGQFQAAWNFSSVYLGLVLGAMGTDYYPRLSAVNRDNALVCRLVNEQTEMALLLSGPVIVGMICFMDTVVSLFYSAKFSDSITVLLWQTLGDLFKVISWPMGFTLLAKNKGGYFVLTEILWDGLFVAIIWLLWDWIGLAAAGIAFVVGYLVLMAVYLLICKRICGFVWSGKCLRHIAVFIVITVSAFCAKVYLGKPLEYLGIILLLGAAAYSYHQVNKIIHIGERLLEGLKKILGAKTKDGQGR